MLVSFRTYKFGLEKQNRTREEVEDEPTTSAATGGMTKPERCVLEAGVEVGIQPGSYKLVYRDGTSDVLVVMRPRGTSDDEEGEKEESRGRARKEERTRRVDSWLARVVGTRDEEDQD